MMLSKTLAGTILLACGIGVASSAAAQTPAQATAVTFNVPVALTQLSADIERVRISCAIHSDALTVPQPLNSNPPYDETWVVAGTVHVNMHVVFPLMQDWLQNASGKTAQYECVLTGYSTTLRTWGGFAAEAGPSAFRASVIPQTLTGTFTW
jgi:hypothetical protein